MCAQAGPQGHPGVGGLQCTGGRALVTAVLNPLITSKRPPGAAKVMVPGRLVPLISRLLNRHIVSTATVVPSYRGLCLGLQLSGPQPVPCPPEHPLPCLRWHTMGPLCPWPGELEPSAGDWAATGSSTGSRGGGARFQHPFHGPGIQRGLGKRGVQLPASDPCS